MGISLDCHGHSPRNDAVYDTPHDDVGRKKYTRKQRGGEYSTTVAYSSTSRVLFLIPANREAILSTHGIPHHCTGIIFNTRKAGGEDHNINRHPEERSDVGISSDCHGYASQ